MLITTYVLCKEQADDNADGSAHSDAPIKQLILMMDEEKHFIIQDLDETHLLVSADSVDMIKEQLEEEVR